MKYYGITRSSDHLAHYGIKGMRWGVRKAIAAGNQKALDRHYKKASKKLAKLTDIGLNSKKYAGKATAYGAAAAGTGTIAALGKVPIGIRKVPKHGALIRYFIPGNQKALSVWSGIASAGLTAKSAQNAYRATHGPKYRAKAVQFKNAMDDAFAGTKYEGHYERPLKKRKR